MKKIWQWLLGLLGVLVVAVVLVIVFFDWNWLRLPVQARLSAMTGKQIHIDGPITGTKSWIPHIVFNSIRIDEPGFTAAPKVGKIDSVAIEIDLSKLLHGTLDFPLIEIKKPNLDLVRDAAGKANWDIAAETKGPGDRTDIPLIGRLKIDNGKITYRDFAKKLTIDATITGIAADGGSGVGAFTAQGNGVYRNAPFTLKLKGGSLDDMRENKKPYDIDLAASVGNTKVSVKGTVMDPFKMTDMNVQLTASGDDAGDLYTIFGVPAPTTPPYNIAGKLDRNGNVWQLKDMTGTVGKSDLEGDLWFLVGGPRLDVKGNLLSKNLNFADLGLLVGAPGSTTTGRPVSAEQKKLAQKYAAEDRVLPDVPLDLNEVRDIDADVTFKGEHIQAQSLPLENVDMHLILENAVLSFTPLKVGVAGGLIDAKIIVDARTDAVATDYDVRFHKFQIEKFMQSAGFANGGTGMIDGRIQLHGIGDSVRKSLGDANGEASAIVAHGTISNLAADILGLDVAKALGLLITGDKQIPLNCMVADFKVENGLMTPRALVLDTDASLVKGSGTVNLANEHLDLAIDGDPKSASPLSLGGPITVGGTFRSPNVGLGAEAIARGAAATALGIFLTPLAAIVAFVDTGDAPNADCAALQQQAEANAKIPPPKGKPAVRHQGK
jgi:uncharacterized protein involved in outer membrane biogenesis